MRRLLALPALVALACAAAQPGGTAPARGEAGARDALARFAGAVEAGRWADAQALLSARWRAVYTPARLATDAGGAGPVGREAAERVLAALDAGTPLQGDPARRALPVGAGRAAVAVLEEGGWRVDALE
jgi:hypothetical protein